MDQILDQGITITLWVQALGVWFKPVAEFFSFLGSELFFLLLAPAIYWCYDPKLGIRAGIFLTISSGFNAIFKVLFHSPRPYWYNTEVHAYSAESSFGRPSGHAQTSVVIWGTIAYFIRQRSMWIIAFLLVFFIGLSRIYLGVHFPSDVLIGWIISVVLLWLLLHWEERFLNWFKKLNILMQLFFIMLVSLSFITLFILIREAVGEDAVLQSWIENAALTAPEAESIDPLSFSSIVSYSGAFLGMAIGAIWIGRRGWFNASGSLRQLVLRFLIGLIGVIILWSGLGSLFPDGREFIPLMLRYFRYGLTGFWIIGVAPIIFIKLKLTTTVH
jgi:membrane-associated phospholipid phosphatase